MERQFEARLRRARSDSRPQYLRIKALALREARDAAKDRAAAALLQRILDEYPDSHFDVSVACDALADLAVQSGDLVGAEKYLRAALELGRRGDPVGHFETRLASVLLELGDEKHWPEVKALLDRLKDLMQAQQMLPQDIFDAVVASARLAVRIGSFELAQEEARSALRIAILPGNTFQQHPGLTKVKITPETSDFLESLARGEIRDG